MLDPFAGTDTTLVTAYQLGRNSVGVEIDPKNSKMIHERIEDIRDPDNIEKFYQDYIHTEKLPEIWGIKSSVKMSAKSKSKQPSFFG